MADDEASLSILHAENRLLRKEINRLNSIILQEVTQSDDFAVKYTINFILRDEIDRLKAQIQDLTKMMTKESQ